MTGRKIVYCHTPARWLYQSDRYLRGRGCRRAARRRCAPCAARALGQGGGRIGRPLPRQLDRRRGADRSASTASRPTSLPPPPALDAGWARASRSTGIEPGFVLCVSRLLPYKNVDAVVRAFASLPGERLVVAGAGPDESALRALGAANVHVRRPRHGRAAPLALRELRPARRRVPRGLRPDSARGGDLRQAVGRPSLGRLPRHGDARARRASSSTPPEPASIASAVREARAAPLGRPARSALHAATSPRSGSSSGSARSSPTLPKLRP